MIRLTRLNQQVFYLNPELIECIEETPDTVITLIGGKTVMVADKIEDVVKAIIMYRRKVHGTIKIISRRRKKPSNIDLDK